MKRKRRQCPETTYFIKVWNASEGDIDLLCKIFDLDVRACTYKAANLRRKGIPLCRGKSSKVVKENT